MTLSKEREPLVLANLRLATAIAARLAPRLKYDLEDAQQIAYEGLVMAACRFDERYGVPFAAFAAAQIRFRLHQCLREVVPNERALELARKAVDARDRSPDLTQLELAAELGVTIERLGFAMLCYESARPFSIESSQWYDSVSTQRKAFVFEERSVSISQALWSSDPGPEEIVARKETAREVVQAFQALPEREQFVVRCRLSGIPDRVAATKMNRSRQRPPQIFKAALARMRPMLAGAVA